MRIILATALIRFLSIIPLRLLHALAVPMGWILRVVPWRRHSVIAVNLALCFPDLDRHERERLHRRHLIEMMRLVLESGAVWYWSGKRLERHIRNVEGWEQVEAAHGNGRGVIFVGAHFGNWEILPLWISRHVDLAALYRAPRAPAIDRRITASRGRFGARMIASGSPAMRQMLATLRKGGAIGLLADQQPKQGEGVFVPFFGVPALTMTLVNRLAQRTGCEIFFATVRRVSGGWALRFEHADETIADEDPVEGMRTMNRWLESEVQSEPAQYLWNYKRFSLRPDGEPPPYPARKRR